MRHSFTPAAERALAEAAAWSLGEFSDALEAPALLLGLLAESECRAAMTLSRHAVNADAVLTRWPSLVRMPNRFAAWPSAPPIQTGISGGMPVRHFAPEVQASLATVVRRLRKWGAPPELGTEHMLLGLTVSGHEVSQWLSQWGIQPEPLEEEILRALGYEPLPASASREPLPMGEEFEGAQPLPDALAPPEPIAARLGWPAPEGLTPQERLRVMRVIDASANRAREGLRVVEDFVRFALDDRFLTGLLKSLRHDLTGVLARFSSRERMAARDTLADVGTQLVAPGERDRGDTASVAAANFARLQESLRSLEEFTKIVDPTASAALEQIRYQTYTLQRAAETTRSSLVRLHHARLYVLINGRPTLEEFRRLAQSLVAAGVHVLQLRDKRLDDRNLLNRARVLREVATEGNAIFIMNDRPDLAALSRADGVHVGQEELCVKDARSIVGTEALVGVSTHSVHQARQAVLDGADYIGVGPVFPSETKQFEQFPGVELVREVAAEIRLPAFAIGGIGLDTLPRVLDAGLRRVAVGAAISNSSDPAAAVRAFLDALR